MRRALQHIPIVILVSMFFGWTGMRFFPTRCWLLGFDFDLRGLAVALPLITVAIVLLTFRYGRVFCSWFCPTHLFLEGARWVSHRAKGWSTLAVWLLAIVSAAFVTHALVTCFVPISEQIAQFKAEGLSGRLFLVEAGLFAWFVVHFALLRWRFCIYACPYGLPLLYSVCRIINVRIDPTFARRGTVESVVEALGSGRACWALSALDVLRYGITISGVPYRPRPVTVGPAICQCCHLFCRCHLSQVIQAGDPM